MNIKAQAEPRTIAYRSGDKLFRELYEVAGDAYRELARRSWLVAHGFDPGYDSPGRKEIDEKWVKVQRGKYKTLILSGIYGQSIKTLSANAGLTYEDGKAVWDGFIGQMKTVAKFRDENIEWAKEHHYYKSILGEKIPAVMKRIMTTANNGVVQGFAAILLATFFYNCIERAMSYGIDVTSKMVIHDSQTIEFPINKLFHMDLICRKHFQQACKKYYICNYKYDWDLLLDMKHHMPYSFDINTGEVNINMWTEKVDYLLDHLATSYSFKILNRENYVDQEEAGMDLIISHCKGHYHSIMNNEAFLQKKKTNVKLQLTEPLKNIDFWSEHLPDTLEEYVHQIKWMQVY